MCVCVCVWKGIIVCMQKDEEEELTTYSRCVHVWSEGVWRSEGAMACVEEWKE